MGFWEFINRFKDLFALITSVCSIIISIIALKASISNAKAQRQHNLNSVLPICDIESCDYENNISVKIHNNGLGVMIIESLHFEAKNGDSSDSLINLMPNIKEWKTFRISVDHASILPRESMVLIQAVKFTETEKAAIRKALSEITVTIKYRDIYKNRYENTRDLMVYRRHFINSGEKNHAESKGESLNGFVNRAIDETMERDKGE